MTITVRNNVAQVRARLSRDVVTKVGYPEESTGSDTYENGFPIAHNAAVQVFGNPGNTLPSGQLAPIPPRDFMGQGASDWRQDWIRQDAGRAFVVSYESNNPELFGEAIGLSLQGFIREAFTSGSWEGNSPYTVAAKGSSQPLIDDGILRRKVDFVVEVR